MAISENSFAQETAAGEKFSDLVRMIGPAVFCDPPRFEVFPSYLKSWKRSTSKDLTQ